MDKRTTDHSIDNKTRDLLELSSTWEDNRSVEEIIKEIYDSRVYRKIQKHL
jgi:hypothetical protein